MAARFLHRFSGRILYLKAATQLVKPSPRTTISMSCPVQSWSQVPICQFSTYNSDNIKSNIVAAITQRTKSIPVNSLLYRPSDLHKVIDGMLMCNFKETDITKLFLSVPQLMSCEAVLLDSGVRFLRNQGFSVRQISLLFKRNPNIIYELDSVSDVVNFFRAVINLPDGYLQEALVSNPKLLTKSADVLMNNYEMLMGIFRRSDIQRMVQKNPLVLLQNEKEVQDKVNYIYHKMGQDQTEMVWASILSRSLDDIQARHEFLLRAGGFEKPDKKGVTKTPNPYLKDILGSSDKQFVKMAGLSLEEFTVFKKILLLEKEMKQKELDELLEEEEEEMEKQGYQREKVMRDRMKKKIID